MKLITILAAVGALNWGLTVFEFNLVNWLLGSVPMLENAVYLIVGISGLLLLVKVCKCKGGCRKCEVAAAPQGEEQ